jgi:hypothetical protein
MKIQDLSKELDAQTLSAVRGGDNGNGVTNEIMQASTTYAPVAVMGSGPTNTSVHVNSTQNAGIWNEQFSGDSYLALLPTFSSVR